MTRILFSSLPRVSTIKILSLSLNSNPLLENIIKQYRTLFNIYFLFCLLLFNIVLTSF